MLVWLEGLWRESQIRSAAISHMFAISLMGAHAEKPVIRAPGIDDRVAGHSRLLMMRLSLAQKMFALAAVSFRRCSGFHQTSRSSVSIQPNFKPPFRCGRI